MVQHVVLRRLAAVALLLTACSGDAVETADPTTTTREPAAGCPETPEVEEVEGDSVALQQMGEEDGVRVEAAVYPRPDYEGDLSQWGQGVVLPDGRFVFGHR